MRIKGGINLLLKRSYNIHDRSVEVFVFGSMPEYAFISWCYHCILSTLTERCGKKNRRHITRWDSNPQNEEGKDGTWSAETDKLQSREKKWVRGFKHGGSSFVSLRLCLVVRTPSLPSSMVLPPWFKHDGKHYGHLH